MKQKKLALVIGAGAVKCAASLGVLRVLQRAGTTPDMVVGCSGGAFYAAAIALGWDAERIASVSRRLWSSEVTGRHNRRALLQTVMPRRVGFEGRFGLRDDGPLLRQLEEAFNDQTFAEAQISLFITATDFC